jgi:hypothetical protein
MLALVVSVAVGEEKAVHLQREQLPHLQWEQLPCALCALLNGETQHQQGGQHHWKKLPMRVQMHILQVASTQSVLSRDVLQLVQREELDLYGSAETGRH